MRVAYFSPLPPAHTGVADYSWELLPSLATQLEVTLFVDDVAAIDPLIVTRWSVYPIAAYGAERWNFDAAIYQLGNSFFHEAIYRTACQYPGLVVLHDYNLHHFIAERTLGRGSFGGYRRELAYNLGDAGQQLGKDIRQGKRALPLFEYPLNERVLDMSLGLIAHSEFIAAQVRRRKPPLPVKVIPAPIAMYQAVEAQHVPDWPADALIFASVGQVTASRQIDLVLRAFAEVERDVPQARCLIVGEWRLPDQSLEDLTCELKLGDKVRHIDFVERLDDFAAWIAAADVVVNLRQPSAGETSATALRTLAAGRPLIVNDTGWYHELPETVCLKVPPRDLQALTQAMLSLAQNAVLRAQMGRAAAEYAQRVHSPAYAAAQYVEFVQDCVARWQKPLGE